MKYQLNGLLSFLLFFPLFAIGQAKESSIKGSLFIIGGGNRPPALLRELVATSDFRPTDYVAVLPMSSAEPDSSFYYFKSDFEKVCDKKIVNLNFTAANIALKPRLDSLANARTIFITGGDQDRFMKVVLQTPVYEAIHKAFANGATIAGSSAGAAVMSKYMITGRELVADTSIKTTFRKLVDKNIDIAEGLSLLPNAVIDQHFIVRSRYNRLLSAVAKYPSLACIGIDESTAIIVQGNHVRIAGESQVIVLQKPTGLTTTKSGLIKMKDIQLSIYTAGDRFLLK